MDVNIRRSVNEKKKKTFSGPKFDAERTSLQHHIWTINSPYTETPRTSTLEFGRRRKKDVVRRYKTTPSVDRNLTINNDTEKTSL